MIIALLKDLLRIRPEDIPMDAEYEPFREELLQAGLSEEKLRRMDPDERVAALEDKDPAADAPQTGYPVWTAWDGISSLYQKGAVVSHNGSF